MNKMNPILVIMKYVSSWRGQMQHIFSEGTDTTRKKQKIKTDMSVVKRIKDELKAKRFSLGGTVSEGGPL